MFDVPVLDLDLPVHVIITTQNLCVAAIATN